MRIFAEVLIKACLSDTFTSTLIEKSNTDVSNQDYKSLKEFLASSQIRISALELAEVRRIFERGDEDVEWPPESGVTYHLYNTLRTYREILFQNLDSYDSVLITNSSVAHEILALMIFDQDFFEEVVNETNVSGLLVVLNGFGFKSTELTQDLLRVLTLINRSYSQEATDCRNKIHNYKWIRPSTHVFISNSICWGNVSRMDPSENLRVENENAQLRYMIIKENRVDELFARITDFIQ